MATSTPSSNPGRVKKSVADISGLPSRTMQEALQVESSQHCLAQHEFARHAFSVSGECKFEDSAYSQIGDAGNRYNEIHITFGALLEIISIQSVNKRYQVTTQVRVWVWLPTALLSSSFPINLTK
ncbi:unnamed protein product [Hydatigera taeniaeformis]|uniref:Uncharacterized protein n=1 Tax=Hydatigena taeniaeformis TaxID=6205 RepID=A0A0R3XDC6_HYDTA|nr:unnamed protein product [Hydatigera taeniaeformis]